jgi:hypothetical protein
MFETLTVYDWLNFHKPVMFFVNRYPFILNWAIWKQQSVTLNVATFNFTKEIPVWPEIDITAPPTYKCYDETAQNCSKTCTYGLWSTHESNSLHPDCTYDSSYTAFQGNHTLWQLSCQPEFIRAILFAMECQTTIGYGARFPQDRCMWPQIVQSMQYIMNQIIFGGIMLITTQRIMKSQTLEIIKFTGEAVICLMPLENKPCLVVRVGPKQQNLVGFTITAKLLVTRRTAKEKTLLPLEEIDIKLQNDLSLFGAVPIDYYHVIDEDSPFYQIDPDYRAFKNEKNQKFRKKNVFLPFLAKFMSISGNFGQKEPQTLNLKKYILTLFTSTNPKHH